MESNPEEIPSAEGAPLLAPLILPQEPELVMPGKSAELALTSYTVAAYLVPAVIALIFGLDWAVFAVCIGCELLFFLWARAIQMWIMPGGAAAALTTVLMLPPLGFLSLMFLGMASTVLLGGPIEINGKLQMLSPLSRLAIVAAMVSLAADAVRRFQKVTLAKIHFMQRVNERYMFEGEPNVKLFTGRDTIGENILLCFLGGSLAGIYLGVAMGVMALIAIILRVFVSEQRAWGAGAVIGFSVIRLAWEILRTQIERGMGPPPKTESEFLERMATVSRKRIVLRDAKLGGVASCKAGSDGR